MNKLKWRQTFFHEVVSLMSKLYLFSLSRLMWWDSQEHLAVIFIHLLIIWFTNRPLLSSLIGYKHLLHICTFCCTIDTSILLCTIHLWILSILTSYMNHHHIYTFCWTFDTSIPLCTIHLWISLFIWFFCTAHVWISLQAWLYNGHLEFSYVRWQYSGLSHRRCLCWGQLGPFIYSSWDHHCLHGHLGLLLPHPRWVLAVYNLCLEIFFHGSSFLYNMLLTQRYHQNS